MVLIRFIMLVHLVNLFSFLKINQKDLNVKYIKAQMCGNVDVWDDNIKRDNAKS